MTSWATETTARLLGFARDDVMQDGIVRPSLTAFRDGRELLIAWLRPFEQGAYADPIIEVAALALPLGANQLAVCLSGRAWSLDDPVPPVSDDTDLRQQVIMVQAADGTTSPPSIHTTLQPYDGERGVVSFEEPVDPGPDDGWISHTLTTLTQPDASGSTWEDAPAGELYRQAARVVRLGHDLWLHPDVHDLVLSSPLPV